MTVKEAINRGNNIFYAAFLALTGIAFFPEIFMESEGAFKLDEGLLAILGVVAVVWYFLGKNRYTRSFVPVVLIYLGLAIKIMAIILEFKDKEDVGDDFGAVTLFVCASIFATWLFIKSKKLLAEKE